MAIGDVSASGGLALQPVNDRAGQIAAQGASGLGAAVNDLVKSGFAMARSATEIDSIYDRRAMASEGTALQTKFLQYQEQQGTRFTDYARDYSGGPTGMTSAYREQLVKDEQEFLKNVPPRLKEEFIAKLERDRASRVGSMFAKEVELMDVNDKTNLGLSLNTLGSSLKGGGVSLDDAQASWDEQIDQTQLPPIVKEEMKRNGRATLQGLEFGTVVEQTAMGLGVANSDMSGGDIVAAGISPQGRGVLNAISSVEAKSYDIWNGGQKFQGYSDHPANLGQTPPGASSAAGRYQFIRDTWNTAKASYEKTYGQKVADFSPEWQDRVALHWAEVQYNKWNQQGLNFQQVLASGDPALIATVRQVLGNPKDPNNKNSVEWQGLGDGYGMSDDQFVNIVTGQQGIQGGGTGSAGMPNVWTDPRFSDLSLDDKLKASNAAQAAAESAKVKAAKDIADASSKFVDSMYSFAYQGGDLSQMEQFRSSPYWGTEAEKQYRQGVDDYRKKETSTAEVGRMIETGQALSSRDSEGYRNWFGEDNIVGLASGQAASYDKLRYAVERTHQLPDGAKDALLDAMANPQTDRQALNFLGSLHEGDPGILTRAGFTNEQLTDITLFKRLAATSSPEAAYERFQQMKESAAALGLNPGKARTEAIKSFDETFGSPQDIAAHLSPIFSFTPDMSKNEATARALSVDARQAYSDGYLLTGSVEGAEEYMTNALNKMWGVSYAKGNSNSANSAVTMGLAQGWTKTLMKYPPEKFYSPADGEFTHIYDSMEVFAVSNLPGGTTIRPGSTVLVSDQTTEQEVRNGQAPTYTMLATGEYGEALVVPGRFGGAYLEQAADEINKRAADRQAGAAEYSRGLDDIQLLNRNITELEASNIDGRNDEALMNLKATRDNVIEQTTTKRKDLVEGKIDNSAGTLWRLYEDSQRKAGEALFGSDTNSRGELAEQATVELLDQVEMDPETSRRVQSRATTIQSTTKREDGGRYSDIEAYTLALEEIIAKELVLNPDQARELVRRYQGGSIQ